jgi:hypothetical protein
MVRLPINASIMAQRVAFATNKSATSAVATAFCDRLSGLRMMATAPASKVSGIAIRWFEGTHDFNTVHCPLILSNFFMHRIILYFLASKSRILFWTLQKAPWI